MQRILNALPDLTAFLVCLGAAWLFQWHTEDLVWSLWLASLVVGYATMISLILASRKAAKSLRDPSDIWGHGPTALPAHLRFGPYVAFAFFCFHSSAFYAMHVAFISSGFDNPSIDAKAFWDSVGNPFRLWALIFEQVLPVYGLMLLPILIAERGALQRTYQKQYTTIIALPEDPKGKRMGAFMFKPYLNVMKLQFVIFWLLKFEDAERQQFWIYGVVFFLYFFPWYSLFSNGGADKPAQQP